MFDKELFDYTTAVLNDFSGLEGIKATSHYKKGLVFIPLDNVTVYFEIKDTQTASWLTVGYLGQVIFKSIISLETVELILNAAIKVAKDYDQVGHTDPVMGDVINHLFHNHTLDNLITPTFFKFLVNDNEVSVNSTHAGFSINGSNFGDKFLERVKELEL